MGAIKIVGEWRRNCELKPGYYLIRTLHGDLCGTVEFHGSGHGKPDLEYLGPIEIVEPEPVPTPLPGCQCNFDTTGGGRYWCQSATTGNIQLVTLITYGTTKRQAILRHNAAVAAIVAMESKL